MRAKHLNSIFDIVLRQPTTYNWLSRNDKTKCFVTENTRHKLSNKSKQLPEEMII